MPLNRLSEEEKREALHLIQSLHDNASMHKKESSFVQLGRLIERADAYQSLNVKDELVECSYVMYERVWREVVALRKSGKLLEWGKKIVSPVVALHGDHDPHPADGVRIPLFSVLRNFRFLLLHKCGHVPWKEKWASKQFYTLLKAELS